MKKIDTMKGVIILFLSLVILVGCGEGVIYGKWEAYIDGYYSYDDIELRVDNQMQISINPIGVEFLCDILGNGDQYLYSKYQTHYQDYYKQRVFNDASKTKPWHFGYAVDYESIEITCSRDWNEQFAAGESLAEIVTLKFVSLYKFISSDRKDGKMVYEMSLAEMTADDLKMLGHCSGGKVNQVAAICFAAPPAEAGEYPVTVKMITTDGQVFEKSITLTVE